MNSSHAEALIIRRERPLKLLIVDEAAVVPIRRLETSHDVRIRSRRKRRREQRRERASVSTLLRRRSSVASVSRRRRRSSVAAVTTGRRSVAAGRRSVGGLRFVFVGLVISRVGRGRRRCAVRSGGRWRLRAVGDGVGRGG